MLSKYHAGRALALIVAIFCSYLALPVAQAATNPSAITINNSVCNLAAAGYLGSGSSADPWQISDSASLWEVTDCEAQSPGGHYVLVSDIQPTNATNSFTLRPIGYRSLGTINKFQGTLDGQGHSITNIRASADPSLATSSAVASAGLFAWLTDATIKNLSISGVYVGIERPVNDADNPEYSTGTIAARSSGNLAISNVAVAATISSKFNSGGLVGSVENASVSNTATLGTNLSWATVGGFFGSVSGSATIAHSTNSMSIVTAGRSDSLDVGGFVGIANAIEISNSTNLGTIAGITNVAGLVGNASVATISGSINRGLVSGGSSLDLTDGSLVAGFVAESGQVHISNSSNFADISVWGGRVAGLVASAISVTILGSQNRGTIDGRDGRVAGLVSQAFSTSIENSYNSGQIRGDSRLGGLIQASSTPASVVNSYNQGSFTQTPDWHINSYSTNSLAVTPIDGLQALGSGVFSSSYTTPPSSRSATTLLAGLRNRDLYVGWDFANVWGFDCNEVNPTPKLRALSPGLNLRSDTCPIVIVQYPEVITPPLAPNPNETPPGPSTNSSTSSASATSSAGSAGPSGQGSDRSPSTTGSYTASPAAVFTISGRALDLVQRLFLGSFSATISSVSDSSLQVLVPSDIPLGKYDLILESNSGRFLSLQAVTIKAKKTVGLLGKSFLIPKFLVSRSILNLVQRNYISKLLIGSGATRVVCTGITTKAMSHHQRVFVRQRAKASCSEVGRVLPGVRVWVQSKVSEKTSMAQRVVLTIKG
jgi:hypothetical protein